MGSDQWDPGTPWGWEVGAPVRNGYKAGVRMDFDNTSPSQLAEAIINNIGAPVKYASLNPDGAKRAASMIIELLLKGK